MSPNQRLKNWFIDDLSVPAFYWLVVVMTVVVTVLLLAGRELDEYPVAGKVFVAAINLASPAVCLTFAILTRRTGLRGPEFTKATTTIRSVATAWLGFFAFAVVANLTSLNFNPELGDLYVLAAVTSLLALAGPAFSELATSRCLALLPIEPGHRLPFRRYGH